MDVKKIKFVVLFVLMLALSGCAGLVTRDQTKGTVRKKTYSGTSDDFSGGAVESAPAEEPIAEPATPEQEKKVAIIFGPGTYKMFAHAGVLKALQRKNIPIHKVVGVEWGALVAGLYAIRGQVNEVEWKLYKLEKLNLGSGGFFSRTPETKSIQVLEDFFKVNVDKKDISQLAVPFSCPILNIRSGTTQWVGAGSLPQAIESCLPYPPLFNPRTGYVAAALSVSDTAHNLRREGYNVVILVNVLSEGDIFENSKAKVDLATRIVWAEARRDMWRAKAYATDVIDVNSKGVAITDFNSRKLLQTAGEAAGDKAASELVSKYGF